MHAFRESGFEHGGSLTQGVLQHAFQRRSESQHRQFGSRRSTRRTLDVLHDLAAKCHAHGARQRDGILAAGAGIRQHFGDGLEVAQRHLLGEQRLQHLGEHRERERLRDEVFGELGRGLGQRGQELLRLVEAEQLRRVLAHHLRQMRGDDGRRIDHGVAERLRMRARAGLDPDRLHAEGRVLGADAVERAVDAARVERHLAIRIDHALPHRHAGQQQAVVVGQQFEVVADVHGLDQEAQLLGDLLAHALDARHQLAALLGVHQRDQAITDFEAQRVFGTHVVPAQLRGRGGRARCSLLPRRGLLLRDQPGRAAAAGGEDQEDEVGHARDDPDQAQHASGDRQHPRLAEGLRVDLLGHVAGARIARHQHRHRHAGEQRGHLRDQAVADGQQGVVLQRLGERQVVLHDSDQQAAEDVDEQDQDAGDGVAADELAGAVHGAVEVGLLADLLAPRAGVLAGEQAGVEVGVDGHLPAGHGVQHEAGADFRDPLGALGHHHEVDDGEDHEDDEADRVVAADHEVPEGLDHLPRRVRALVAVHQHHPRAGDVERQPQQGGEQQHGREGAELQRPHHVDDREQDHQRQRDVEAEEEVQHRGGERHHHHRQDRQQEDRRRQSVPRDAAQAGGGAAQQRVLGEEHGRRRDGFPPGLLQAAC